MNACEPFEIKGADGKLIRGDRCQGTARQILFITGFLSKRWGNKSKALAQWCREEGWGFCCFDFRGFGDSEGRFQDYTLHNWLEDAWAVVRLIDHGPPLTVVGSSLGGWLAWLVAQETRAVHELILIAPGFNMMGERARQISPERRNTWYHTGAMPWDDDELHRGYPISWKWVEESEELWKRRFAQPRRVKTTIFHGLQDTVILPSGSWKFVEHVLSQDPAFPIELLLVTGDHRLSSPSHLETLRRLVVGKRANS
jgi:pimeloyl-ACP methyl ester carboxylesterase